jgi:SAM-dependent methyltransferase
MSTSTPEAFEESARFYDFVYSDRDTNAEAEWVLGQLKKWGAPPFKRILEMGAGTGRHANLFADAGNFVVAVEPSSQMIEKASLHPKVHWVRADARDVRIDDAFDVVLALFHVVSYQTSLKDIDDLFLTANLHLSVGGIFGFDVWFTPAVLHLKPEKRTLLKENENIKIRRVATPIDGRSKSGVTVVYDWTVWEKDSPVWVFSEEHHLRHFSEEEILALAWKHGFAVLDSKEFLTGNKPSEVTWGVYFSLRKVARNTNQSLISAPVKISSSP